MVTAYPQLFIGAAVLVVLAGAAVLAPAITRFDPAATDFSAVRQAPSALHPFGTDQLGRDMLSRAIYGGRLSLTVAVSTVALTLICGATLGFVSGSRRGWVDNLIMRVMDGMLAFPGLILALTIAFVLGPSVTTVIIALAVARTPPLTRLIRGQILALANRDFIQAAVAVGAPPLRIATHHYLPNLVSLLVVQASLSAGTAILTESSLSFLGLGLPPPAPSWGGMLREGYLYLEIHPLQSFIPGALIFAGVLAFNFIGDGARDVLDPAERWRRTP
ncbi:MAG: ABC transporter permease [Chloroflexota bacterium]|nr:ABC transporter permease [Chloroflexota bacterium]